MGLWENGGGYGCIGVAGRMADFLRGRRLTNEEGNGTGSERALYAWEPQKTSGEPVMLFQPGNGRQPPHSPRGRGGCEA